MRIDRRTFLQILGSGVALMSGRTARPADARLPEIHVATRNTHFGALGRRGPSGPVGPPYKTYPNAARTPLPAIDPSAAPPGRSFAEAVNDREPFVGFAGEPLSVDQLSLLLHCCNGVTGRYPVGDDFLPLRAAPSAGANYAGEIYVVVERVRGVPPGLYYYAVVPHRLVRLRGGSLLSQVARSLEDPSATKGASVAVLLTNVFGRYTRRYANRGYRYALIDSGHIGENLRLTASALGYLERSPRRFWDDALNQLLGIDGRSEAICAVHTVGRRATAPDEQASERAVALVESQFTGEPPVEGSEIERFHRATRLIPAVRREDPSRPPPPPPSGSEIAGTVIALPKPEPPSIGVVAAIAARRSAAVFEAHPIELAQLSFALQAAAKGASRRGEGVELLAVAHRVKGLDPGIYRYAPSPHQLVSIHKAALARPLVAACLSQQMAGSAAVGFVMAARLESGASALGDRRYRDLLLESGAIGQRIYLAAEALGLAARNLAAFIDDRFNELLRLDRLGMSALHLTMFGRGQ